MLNPIDRLLNVITMYRLLLYYLGALIAIAALFALLGYISYSPIVILYEGVYFLTICWLFNKAFSRLLKLPSNPESSLITALILSLIVSPTISFSSLLLYTILSLLAIASKYLLNFNGQHMFNPAAIAVVVTSLVTGQAASWWVGNIFLMPFIVIGGILVARKIQRGQMITLFIVIALIMTSFWSVIDHTDTSQALQNSLLHSSLFFLAFVMFTEPLTSPGRQTQRYWYSLIVGFLFPPQLHILHFYSTPEVALTIGNVYSYIVSPRVRRLLHVQSIQKWSATTMDFIFAPPRNFTYLPGQYMEFTLNHGSPDDRGSRRYFTLASSPTEEAVHIGVRFSEEGSSFKKALQDVSQTTAISVGHLGGDFVMPNDPKIKLAFIAGGIGITPFRSMLKYMIDTNDMRDVTLFYSERNQTEICYKDILAKAQELPHKQVIYTLSDEGIAIPEGMYGGRITKELIKTHLPDYKERLFYLSGPHPMVVAMKHLLKGMGVPSRHIKEDFFPGYA